MQRLQLTDAEQAEINTLVDRFIAAGHDWDPLTAAEAATATAQRLPLRLREFLTGARTAESGITVVSGVPLDPRLADTPIGWEAAAKSAAGRREEIALLLCGAAMGDPFGWESQQEGRLVHDVSPSRGMETSLTSASSEKTLSLHTEDVFHPCRADYVALLCLRNPDGVATTVAGVDALRLSPERRDALTEPRFHFFPDDSHTGPITGHTSGDDREAEADRVLFGPEQAPYLRFDVDFMEAADPGAGDAMRAADELLSSSPDRVVLNPGDLVFIDNYKVVHGRAPFTPRYDGADRWLKRLNLLRDVRRLYARSNTRTRLVPA
ncbi:TauD/TfdA family dioxygenase [Streptomyces tsukubensis]|uniref:Oxygenase n=1 Tax=Streptomyces tsukubensis TaxID=83656 RepID=A0A1V4A2P8_9ACTN|nr:TauD/TfdA family dioxygenase [Streptomyces tsukubensis]OON72939.1 oxygenase [Streptomyces tsukubensis]QFR94461.1 oxygenase [Streptomyces tsukubensis]